jgi:hypothetical protein
MADDLIHKLMMYGNKSNDEWYHSSEPIIDDIESIKDPEADKNKQDAARDPKVSIPSPFARFELMQEAFKNVSANRENAYTRDKRLVSFMLDVAQLYYESGYDSIEDWQQGTSLDELKNGTKSNALLGDTLEMYSAQETFGFDNGFTLYFIICKGQVVGATSPTSLFIPIPDTDKISGIKVGGKFELFDKNYKLLNGRDPKFVDFLYCLWGNFKKKRSLNDDETDPFDNFDSFLMEQDGNRYRRFVKESQDDDYIKSYTQGKVYIGDFNLRCRPKDDASNSVASSDFIICSSKSKDRPLVLSNNMKNFGLTYYGTEKWNSANFPVLYGDRQTNKKKLPWTNIDYEDGWLCEHDFLSDCLVRLPYKMNSNYYSFVEGESNNGYLLPLTSTFFKYFDTDYLLKENIVTRKPNLIMEEVTSAQGKEEIRVTLYIPIKGGSEYIPLQKLYSAPESESDSVAAIICASHQAVDSDSPNMEEQKRKDLNKKVLATGKFVEIPLSFTVFPFAKLKDDTKNLYYIQFVQSYITSPIQFGCRINGANQEDQKDKELPNDDAPSCYEVKNSFDYFHFEIGEGEYQSFEAVAIPDWEKSVYKADEAHNKFKFAIDFGTTNSFVAVTDINENDKDGFKKKNFELKQSVVTSFDPNDNNISNQNLMDMNYFQSAIKQRFVPLEIEKNFFPLRSVVITPRNLNQNLDRRALINTCIPFFYGREDYGRDKNKLESDIKWSPEVQGLAKSFIHELMLICRGYVLENGGDLAQTEFVWTYPLSMRPNDISDFNEIWKDGYKSFFGGLDENVSNLSESVAPYLSYLKEPSENCDISHKMTLSVDIGGGTTDVVFVDKDGNKEISSLRFAANVLFGGRDTDRAGNNPMIQFYYDHFRKIIEAKAENREIENDGKLTDLLNMLNETCTDTDTPNSCAEANTTLFSLENQPLLKDLSEAERSYNKALSFDKERHVIFIYFYALIIYYLVNVLKQNSRYTTPSVLLFSGTGSKVLNIVGSKDVLTHLTSQMLDFFSDGKYSYKENERLEIKIERIFPKELTARGALYNKSDAAKEFSDPRVLETCISKFHMVPDAKVEDLERTEVQEQILNQIDDFNSLFVKFIEKYNILEDYRCSESSFEKLKSIIGCRNEIEASLRSSISRTKEKSKKTTDPIRDDIFFEPIKTVVSNFINDNM